MEQRLVSKKKPRGLFLYFIQLTIIFPIACQSLINHISSSLFPSSSYFSSSYPFAPSSSSPPSFPPP